MGALQIEVCAESLILLPARAVFWPRTKTLLVADMHLGKAATFQHFGLAIPDGELAGTTHDDLARLSQALTETGATRLFILGDLLHAAKGRAAHVLSLVQHWRERHPTVAMTLIRGNHDQHAGDPPADWRIQCVDEPYLEAPFAFCHRPGRSLNPLSQAGYEIAGHVHPGITLIGKARQRQRLPCCVVGAAGAVLPAFGSFTGLATLRRESGDRVYAFADQAVLQVKWSALPA